MRKFSARVFGARHRGERGERGAVLVETAIILPLLVLLIAGIVEFGMTFREASTITASTRAGARMASSMPRQTNFAQATADAVTSAIQSVPSNEPKQLWIYEANANGFPDSATSMPASCSHCVVFNWNSSTKSFGTPVSNNYPPTGANGQSACAGNTDSIGVYVTGLHTGIFPGFPDRTLTSKTVMKLEPVPSTSTCTG